MCTFDLEMRAPNKNIAPDLLGPLRGEIDELIRIFNPSIKMARKNLSETRERHLRLVNNED